MPLLDFFKRKDFALPPERREIASKSENLDAKLHQGYDPDSEFKERGTLFSSVQYSEKIEEHPQTTDTLSDKGFIGNIIHNILDIFDNTLADQSQGQSASFQAGKDYNYGHKGDRYQAAFRSGLETNVAGGDIQDSPGIVRNVNSANNMAQTNVPVAAGGRANLSAGGGGGGGENEGAAAEAPNGADNDPGHANTYGAPSLRMSAASGAEGDPMHLDIETFYDGPDSNLIITISNVPAGNTLSAGQYIGSGVWELDVNDLNGLYMTLPSSWSGTMQLNIAVTANDNGNISGVSSTLPISVSGVASAPTISVQSANGFENVPIPLIITASLTDTDGSETLSVTISGVPSGGILSAGTNNGNDTWTLTPAELAGLLFIPPTNFSGSLDLHVSAISSENNSTYTVGADLSVNISGVAGLPTLSTQNSVGIEDTAVPVVINAALTDVSGETLSVIIGNVPAGASLSAGMDNHDGTWTLTQAQLAGLTVIPPANFSGQITLDVTAISSENGTTAQISGSLQITIGGVADAPSLSMGPVSGFENTPLSLNIHAALTDRDGSEAISITIGGVPSGATLSAGTNNGNGTWTLTQAQLSGLTLTPPAYYSGTLSLIVSATSSENGTSATTTLPPVSVFIEGVASQPTLSIINAAGIEGTPIPLVIAAALTDTDGSETLSITIGNVPTGALLSAGIDNGNGTWTLMPAQLTGLTITPTYTGALHLNVSAVSTEGISTAVHSTTLDINVLPVAHAPVITALPAMGVEDGPVILDITVTPYDPAETDVIIIGNLPPGSTLSAGTDNGNGTWTLTPAQLTGLTLTPAADWNGSLNLSITATADLNGTTSTTSTVLPLSIAGVADAPSLSLSNVSGLENTPVALHVNAALENTAGHEVLSVTIGGIPSGAVLSAGTDNHDGSWTLSSAQLAGLTITPPPYYSGTLTLSVIATASENGTHASTSGSFDLSIAGVASTPLLNAVNAAGLEDTAIPLGVTAALVDTDGSETLSITIGNIPVGATLSAGIDNLDGSWTLTPAQLTGLTLTPPLNYSGTISLDIIATSFENTTHATAMASLDITVGGVATAPTLSINAATGLEDNAIPLTITAALVDTDSETLSVTIGNIPAGAALSAGTDNHDGSWSLTPAQLAGLTIYPPSNFSGQMNLTVTAISSENGTQASTSAPLIVAVSGVADIPNISVQGAAGAEGSAIALSISASLNDIDGSENLAVIIGNVPPGAVLSAGTDNHDGTWTLNSSQLTGLTITPAPYQSGTLNLSIIAVASENGTTAQTNPVTLPVIISGIADIPTLNVAAVSGAEDTAIPLIITAALADTDGSETLSITVSGMPPGASLSAGTNNNGTWTLTGAQLSGLTMTPPSNFSGQINLNVTATSTEGASTASLNLPLTVSVSGVADVPNISVQAATGAESSSIALNISASLNDIDGSETLSVVIGNVPSGAVLSAGTNNHDGTWTLNAGQLTGLTITPPLFYSGTMNLSVVAVAAEDGTSAQTLPVTLPVTVSGLADLPTLNVQAAIGLEDTAIPLVITAGLSDMDGSETLSVTIGSVPAGAVLSAGTNNHDGTWTLTAAELSGLTLTPPANWSGNFVLSVSAVSTEGLTHSHIDANLNVTVTGVADLPTLTLQTAIGIEDTAIALNIGASLADTDGSENLSITIAGVLAGASLSAGTNNGNGTWTLTPAQLTGLTFTPPAHLSGNFALVVTATANEGASSISAIGSMTVHVEGAATTPLLSVLPVVGAEDTAIALNITTALVDIDGSENLSVVIGGVPAGANFSAGVNNNNGTWTFTPVQLTGLTFTPPSHRSGLITLSVQAISSENGTTALANAALPVSIGGVATPPSLSVSAATALEDVPVPLVIAAALLDTDGSETLSLMIGGLPAGASLSAGTDNHDGTWSLTAAQLTGLLLNPPANWSGSFDLSVTATSHEGTGHADTHLDLHVTINGVADIPALSVQAAAGIEDTSIALNIAAGLSDTDGSETLSIAITGVPAGAVLSTGTSNGNGTWTLTPTQLTGLTITPPVNWSGLFALTVTATASEGVTSAANIGVIPVVVGGNADAPTLNVSAAVGLEDTAITLNIAAGLTDTDGSETLSITIANVPAGASLSAGTNNHNGTWTLTPAQLSGLKYTPPLHMSGLVNLSVTATATENGASVNTTLNLPVTVGGVADAPMLSVLPAAGGEDAPVALNIISSLVDLDGSETLSVTISGVPTGASLSAGLNAGNGVWVLTPAQLTGLTLTPAHNYSGAFALSVVALSSENGTTGTISASLPVTIAAVADAPTLIVSAAAGLEDTAIPLVITAGLVDVSEALSVVISGVPAGGTLSAGLYAGNGRWSLTPAQLTGLTITPPLDYSGTMALTVTAVSTTGDGDDISLSAGLNVVVTPTVDAPILSVVPAIGGEDTAISLNIASALRDVDGSENLSVRISGVPTGAALSAGTSLGGGIWSLTGGQLSGLKITPPAHSDADFTLTVSATATESNLTTSVINTSLSVTVTGVADAPTATASNTASMTNQVNLTLGGSSPDSSETVTYVVHGVPDGFALNHGINNGDNTWSLKSSDLAGLKMTAPEQFAGQLNLRLTAVSHDNDNSVAVSAATSFHARFGDYANGYLVDLGIGVNVGGIGVGVHVAALPDIDLLPATGGLLGVQGIYAKEDTSFLIADAPGLLAIPVVSAVLGVLSKIQFSGVPTGVTFSAGTNMGGGVWQFTSAQLNNLYMNTAANSDVDFTITVVAKLLFGLADVGIVSVPVHMMGIADLPSLSATAGNIAEDGAISLNITGALTDVDGSESLSYLVSGMPAGFSLNHGINNGNGTWSLQAADLASLNVIPAANYSGTANITVSAISTEREGDQSVRQQNLSVTVTAAADAPIIAAQSLTITEDQPAMLNLGVGLRDTDGSEHISSVTISGLPAGATLNGAIDNGNGTWSADVAHLNQVQFVPPAHWHGDVTLSITAVSTEYSNGATVSTTSSLPIHIEAAADAPAVLATDSTGDMDQTIGLHVAAALLDSDGSEHLSALISGVPDHAILSAGLNNGDGTWTLAGAQLSGLTITPPAGFVGDLNLTLTAFSQESNGSTASAHQDFSVHVMPVMQSMVMMSMSSMSFDGGDGNDLYANQGGWTNDNNAVDSSLSTVSNFFTEAPEAPTTNGDHDQAFQNHNNG